jgi:hypothetical protein
MGMSRLETASYWALFTKACQKGEKRPNFGRGEFQPIGERNGPNLFGI